MKKRILIGILLVFFVFSLSGCGALLYYMLPGGENLSIDDILADAGIDINDEDFLDQFGLLPSQEDLMDNLPLPDFMEDPREPEGQDDTPGLPEPDFSETPQDSTPVVPNDTPPAPPEDTKPNEPVEPPSVPEVTPSPSANVYTFPYAFSAEDLYGNRVTEMSLGQKELFLVYLWTTWCPTCVAGMPGLSSLAAEYGDRVGFLSMLADFDTGRDSAINITEDANAPFITIDALGNDLSSLLRLLDSGYVPTAVLIGPDGKVIGDQLVGAGANVYRALIDDYLDSSGGRI